LEKVIFNKVKRFKTFINLKELFLIGYLKFKMKFLSKKRDVPKELPSLAIDEITKESKKEDAENKFKPLPKKTGHSSEEHKDKPEFTELPNSVKEEIEQIKNTKFSSAESEKGYFKEILKSVSGEIEDLNKLDMWYKNKFLPGDIVSQMREYWEKQQPDILLNAISNDLKIDLLEKTNKLDQLEKEWQEIYFKLLSKEEEIRKEEKELKDSLSEFMNVFKAASRRNRRRR